MKLWNLTTRREVANLKGHAQEVFDLAFSADGNLLASGSGDGTVRLWRAPDLPAAGWRVKGFHPPDAPAPGTKGGR